MKALNVILVIVGVSLLSLSTASILKNTSNLFYATQADNFYKEDAAIGDFYRPHVDSTASLGRLTPEAYNSLREMLFRYEESKAFGSDIRLSNQELLANEHIMKAKLSEYEEGLVTPSLFKPSRHIFSVLEAIEKSSLFKILSKMPKGAILHAHDTALCSTDFLIELTYRANLWICGTDGVVLKFSKQRPNDTHTEECDWNLLSDMRKTRGAEVVDNCLRERLSMYPTEHYVDVNYAWIKFRSIFSVLDGLLRYAPVWADYYYNALKEFYADGVQYLEFRSTLPTLYDMKGTPYTQLDTVRIYVETLAKFMRDNPDFIGSRMIYAPQRHADHRTIDEYIRTCIEIKSRYPDFVAGFDLIGQEELGLPLKDFIPQLLSMPDNIDFFFHAGETNWYGSAVDENLIDAVLLGSKRIGHGFGIVKHPLVLDLIKERGVAIEVNPISNQVLTLVSDFRNHPCSYLFANNFPVVISSDDPSFWKASPLTHDFYIAFLGIASAHSDLRLLKKLAINSIQYSALDDVQKADALVKWQTRWNGFIGSLIRGIENAARSSYKIN